MPEADLGLPLTPEYLSVLTAKLPSRAVQQGVLTGRRYGGRDALASGIVHDVAAIGAVVRGLGRRMIVDAVSAFGALPLDLLIALNSGLPGMSSIHANSARDALVKLSTLPLLAGRNIDSQFVVPTVAGCIDLVVHCELGRGGVRRVVEQARGQHQFLVVERDALVGA